MPNVWASMTYDAASNTVFMPVGNAAIDLWGVERTPEDEKYGACILALDATTGDEKWVYQTVHHDLWDFDVPMQPTLIDFKGTPALIFGTKAGQNFVLDRATGQPLTEVEEIDVKPATIPGEKYALKQPLSVGMPQIGAPHLTEKDMWGATPFDQLMCRVIFKGYRYEGLYTAPDTDYSLSFPGSLGGMNWGGLSYDRTANHLHQRHASGPLGAYDGTGPGCCGLQWFRSRQHRDEWGSAQRHPDLLRVPGRRASGHRDLSGWRTPVVGSRRPSARLRSAAELIIRALAGMFPASVSLSVVPSRTPVSPMGASARCDA